MVLAHGLTKRALLVLALLVSPPFLACGLSSLANAQDWPTRPVTVVVPYPPGGVTDSMARIACEVLAKEFGQPFIIDNRGGGGGVLGTQAALRAPRDGYTLLFASVTQITVSPLIHSVKYDTADLVPVSIVGQNIMGMAVNSALGLQSMAELIAYVRARPGKLNYATGGVGTNSHLSGALLAKRAGLDMVAVPFSGGPQALAAMLAGNVQFYFGNLSESVPVLGTGKIRLLAISSEERRPDMPDIPTVAETLPGFSIVAWNGFFGLSGTPVPILKRLEAAVMKVLKDEKVRTSLLNIGVDPVGSSSEQMRDSIVHMTESMAVAVDAAGLRRKQ